MWGTYVIIRMRIFTLIMNEIYISAPKIIRKMAIGILWIANHLALVACFIFYKKWVQT